MLFLGYSLEDTLHSDFCVTEGRFFCILCQEQRHEAIAIPRGKNRTQATKMDVAMEMSNFLHSLLTSRTTQEIGNAINVRNSKVRIMRSNT